MAPGAQQREDLHQIDGRGAQRETSAQAREFSSGSANPAAGLRSEFGEDDVEVSSADWHQSGDRKRQFVLCQKIAVDIPDRHDFSAGLRVCDGAADSNVGRRGRTVRQLPHELTVHFPPTLVALRNVVRHFVISSFIGKLTSDFARKITSELGG
jgi:hypothetical protein